MATFSLSDSLEVRDQLEKQQYLEIQKLYQDMAKRAKSQAKKLKDGTPSDKLQAAELRKLAKQLQAEAEAIGVRIEESITNTLLKTSQAVVGDAQKFNSKIGLTIEGAYRRVPTDIVEVLVSGKLYGDNWSLSKAIWADIKQTQKDINTVIAEGLALNKSSYDIAKDLEKYVDPTAKKPWDWSKVYPGTKKKVDYNAQRLARTMVGHAYQQSVVATSKNNPFVEGIKWISAHTHSTCDLCNERDGKVFPKDKLPLDHPNGKCSFVLDIPKSMTQIADELADWVQGKPNPELDEWFKSMYPDQKPKEIMEKAVKFSGTPTRSSEILDKWGIPVEGIDDLSPEEQESICRDLDKSMTWAKENIPGFSFSSSGTVSKIVFEKSMDCVGYIRVNHTDVHLLAELYSESVSTHEFVHATINMVMKKKGIPHYDYDARDKWVNGVRKEAFKKAELPNKKSNIKKYISDYAITSNEEFLAEAIGYGFYQRNPNTLTKSTIEAFLEAVRNAVT